MIKNLNIENTLLNERDRTSTEERLLQEAKPQETGKVRLCYSINLALFPRLQPLSLTDAGWISQIRLALNLLFYLSI